MSQKRYNYHSSESDAAAYDAEYYRTGCGSVPYERNEYWLRFFGSIADAIIQYLHPHTAFDAGCALGFLVESLRDRGVQAFGADISEFAIANVREDIRPFCRVASITQPLGNQRYDLVACIEVLEHLTPDEASRAVANLTAVTDTILFSSSPGDFNEPTHINVRSPIDWLQLFASKQFSPDLAFNSSQLSPQAMLLRRNAPPLSHDMQVFYNDAVLLSAAIAMQNPDVPPPAQVPPGHILSNAFTKSVEMMRIGDQLSDFVQKNTEMGHLIDGISVVNQDMLRRNADLERRNEDLLRQFANPQSSALDSLKAPLTDPELVLVNKIFDAAFYLSRCEDVRDSGQDPLTHFLEFGLPERRNPHPLFDTGFYLDHHPELAGSGINPLVHFIRVGARAGASPHPLFDTAFYLRLYTDVVESGMNPLIHFIDHGAQEGRRPHPFFNPVEYLAANPDLVGQITNPLIHYVTAGAAEGRPLRIALSREDRTPYAMRMARIEPHAEELHLQKAVARQFLLQPVISVLVPVYRVSLPVLKAMVESVRAQTYSRWELCLAHGDPDDRPARAWLRTMAQDDRRIKVDYLDQNLGISGNSNRALALATGDFAGLLDHDDTLAPFALYEVVKLINEKPAVDFIYSDKDCTNEEGERLSPLFKPKWSPDLMLSANYLTHFCVIRMEHMRAIGGWRTETDGAQDWDLFFRVIERSKSIERIEKVLYHWGIVSTSVASGGVKAKPYALRSQMQTISEHLTRIGGKGKPSLESNGAIRVRWDAPTRVVSIILVSDDPGARMLEHARTLRAGIPHRPVEIVVAAPDVTNQREGDILSVATPPGAPLSLRLNTAVAAGTGWSIIFLDDCIRLDELDWVPELTGPLELEHVAMVSPLLIDSATGAVRHAGMVFNHNGRLEHIFSGLSEHTYGVFGGPSWCRNWSAVTGACFAIRREIFDQVGGFAAEPRYPRLDVDLCLRLTVDHGLRIFYNPYARLLQTGHTRLENWVRDERGPAREFVRRSFPQGDPYFHPLLKCIDGKVLLDLGDDRGIPPIDYAAEARGLASYFDFSPAKVEQQSSAKVGQPILAAAAFQAARINWFLPEFSHPFYGGVHTILRAADYMQRMHKVQSTFITPTPEPVFRSIIQSAFPTLAEACGVAELTSSLPSADAAVATLWTTAYQVLESKNARRKFYFMQDYETRFYPAGSISAMVESTYHFGFTGICNTVSLRDIYTRIGGQADYFDPSIDPTIFHAKTRAPRNRSEPLILFCYARPTHVRNSFELLSEALRTLKKRLGNDVRIVTAGADWLPAQFGLDGVVHNLGLLPYAATGALYRACTAGVALMMTCHPSYLPFELTACGALVITNSNPYNTWLLKHRENCLLAESSPTALADALEEGLTNHALRDQLVANASRLIQEKYSNWDAQLEKIYRILCGVA